MTSKLYVLITVILSFICTHQANAQGWVWAKDAIGSGGSSGSNVKTDPFGNVYVIGIYTGAITFGATTLTYDSTYHQSFGTFFVKYDSFGNVLWAKNINSYYDYISIDKAGNIYVSGPYDSTLTLGSITLNTCGGAIFIAKYNSAGNVLWAKTSGCVAEPPVGVIVSASIGTDSLCNVYVTGEYGGNPLTFGSITLTPTTSSSNLFLVKYDSSGNVIWAKGESGGLGLGTWVNSLSTDKYNNIYITGQFSDTITFGTTTLSVGGTEMFLVKYNASGDVLWAKTEGTWWSEGIVLTTDLHGNVYLSGQYDSSITFGATTLTVSGQAIFLAKYDTSGNPVWAKNTSAISSSDRLYGIVSDRTGCLYITGTFSNLFTICDTTLSTSTFGLFLMKFDSSGNTIWTNTGGSGLGGFVSIAIDTFNNVCLVGGFTSHIFTLGYIMLTIDSPRSSMIVAKFTEGTLKMERQNLLNYYLKLYPNPATNEITLALGNEPSISSIAISDIFGRQFLNCSVQNLLGQSLKIELPFLPDGMYWFRVLGKEGVNNIAFVIKR